MSKKYDLFTMVGRRWFDKVNGNTYHSVEVYVNNKFIAKEGFAYGYEDHYRQTGFDLLKDHGFFMDFDTYYDMELDKREHIECYLFSVTDVSRKKDL